MLRYFYLLCLIIFINLSFCLKYSSCSRLTSRFLRNGHRSKRENPERQRQFKRYDYGVYDKEPVAEIDVASFINSAEDEFNNRYGRNSKKIKYDKINNDDGSLTNELTNINEYYYNPNAKIVNQASQYLKLDTPTEAKNIDDKFPQGFLNNALDDDEDNLIGQQNRNQKEKKCILKNIKIPFFSHNNSMPANGKKDEKRKLYGWHSIRKENKIVKGNNEKFSKIDNSVTSRNINKYDRIKKRSYVERLCPICKRKFTDLKNRMSQSKRNYNIKNLYGIRHNKSDKEVFKNTKEPPNKYDINESKASNNEEFGSYWSDKRKKREDDRNIERQKELEYLEKRIESVTVNNAANNKEH